MRKQLNYFLNKKVNAQGTIERYGTKTNFKGGDTITILLRDITLTDENEKNITIDHAWMKVGKTFARTNPTVNSLVSLNCHVKEYIKGYVNRREYIDERSVDVGVQRASQIKILKRGDGESFKEFYKQRKNTRFFAKIYNDL